MSAMRKLWREFKGFAMGGNMLDLALGFIIGTAFATLIQSLAGNIIMQFVAALFGKPNFELLTFPVNGTDIHYGKFLTDLLNFVLLALVLFLIVKFIVFVGVGQGRAFGDQNCPYCMERIDPNALVCKFCRQPLVDEVPSLTEARERFQASRARRKLSLPPLPRRGAKDTDVASPTNSAD
jgi:large conductance mechanosensitive channel